MKAAAVFLAGQCKWVPAMPVSTGLPAPRAHRLGLAQHPLARSEGRLWPHTPGGPSPLSCPSSLFFSWPSPPSPVPTPPGILRHPSFGLTQTPSGPVGCFCYAYLSFLQRVICVFPEVRDRIIRSQTPGLPVSVPEPGRHNESVDVCAKGVTINHNSDESDARAVRWPPPACSRKASHLIFMVTVRGGLHSQFIIWMIFQKIRDMEKGFAGTSFCPWAKAPTLFDGNASKLPYGCSTCKYHSSECVVSAALCSTAVGTPFPSAAGAQGLSITGGPQHSASLPPRHPSWGLVPSQREQRHLLGLQPNTSPSLPSHWRFLERSLRAQVTLPGDREGGVTGQGSHREAPSETQFSTASQRIE